MLKKQVIAHSIGNLTDARYFAGWMVDFFIFSIDPSSKFYLNPQEIGTFQSWVEGPQFYIEHTEELEENPEKYLVDLNCHGIYLPYSKRDRLSSFDVPVIFQVTEDEIEEYLKFNKGDLAVLVTDKTMSEYKVILKEKDALDLFYEVKNQEVSEQELLHSPFKGIMVHGSDEEKVGFKSYDELDEIFETLQDF